MMIKDFIDEYQRYRVIGERALEQISEEGLNKILVKDGNSPAMLVRHISGNFISRFTDFLTTDGEKPWRDRDQEFADRAYSRDEVETMWLSGWKIVEDTLSSLTDAELSHTVTIRGIELSVHAALSRSLAHVAYHVGQLVLMARDSAEAEWNWISIPKGESQQYNAAPDKEKLPGAR